MDKPFNKNEEKLLLDALNKAKEMGRQMEMKAEKKRWADIKVPLTLADALASLTKDELSAIRITLEISGISALKKQELADTLETMIPAKLPVILQGFDETRYQILKKIADRGGHGFLPLENHQLNYFRDRGLLFTGTFQGRQKLVMPQEVLQAFKEVDDVSYRKTVRLNTEYIKLLQGMLYYYGTLKPKQIEELIAQYTENDFVIWNYWKIFEQAGRFHETLRIELGAFCHNDVWEADQVLQEHEMRPTVSFYPFTKKQLLIAGEPGFMERTPSYQNLVHFIMDNYDISQTEADVLVEDCVYIIQNGESTADVFDYLQTLLEISDLDFAQSFTDLLVALHNHTKQWFIKGYAPLELRQTAEKSTDHAAATNIIDFKTRKKVGRNDPCPCGSGKKFKKCCGTP